MGPNKHYGYIHNFTITSDDLIELGDIGDVQILQYDNLLVFGDDKVYPRNVASSYYDNKYFKLKIRAEGVLTFGIPDCKSGSVVLKYEKIDDHQFEVDSGNGANLPEEDNSNGANLPEEDDTNQI